MFDGYWLIGRKEGCVLGEIGRHLVDIVGGIVDFWELLLTVLIERTVDFEVC